IARALELRLPGEQELVVLEEFFLLVHAARHLVDERIAEAAQARHQRVDVAAVGRRVRPLEHHVERRERGHPPVELLERDHRRRAARQELREVGVEPQPRDSPPGEQHERGRHRQDRARAPGDQAHDEGHAAGLSKRARSATLALRAAARRVRTRAHLREAVRVKRWLLVVFSSGCLFNNGTRTVARGAVDSATLCAPAADGCPPCSSLDGTRCRDQWYPTALRCTADAQCEAPGTCQRGYCVATDADGDGLDDDFERELAWLNFPTVYLAQGEPCGAQ